MNLTDYEPIPDGSLHEYGTHLMRQITRFIAFYSARHAEDPEAWPMSLEGDEWDRTFAEWIGII